MRLWLNARFTDFKCVKKGYKFPKISYEQNCDVAVLMEPAIRVRGCCEALPLYFRSQPRCYIVLAYAFKILYNGRARYRNYVRTFDEGVEFVTLAAAEHLL